MNEKTKEQTKEIIGAITTLNQSCCSTMQFPIQLLLDELGIIISDEVNEYEEEENDKK